MGSLLPCAQYMKCHFPLLNVLSGAVKSVNTQLLSIHLLIFDVIR
jgi:hypothetical protein